MQIQYSYCQIILQNTGIRHEFFIYIKGGAVVVVILWELDLQLPMQSVPIISKVVSLNPANGEVCSIQHYVIKFVSYMRQVSGFLLVLRFLPLIKLR